MDERRIKKYQFLFWKKSRRIKPGDIDVHPTEDSIIVHYTVEQTMLDELDNPITTQRSKQQKM